MTSRMHRFLLDILFFSLILRSAIAAAPLRGSQTVALGDVTVYSSETSGVFDPVWDPSILVNLKKQLKDLQFKVTTASSDPFLPNTPSPLAFMIPPASGDIAFAEVEDIRSLSQYVKSGGLLIVHDSLKLKAATSELVARVLGYEGDWQHCEALTDNTRTPIAEASVSSYAQDFLPGVWPRKLENARDIQVHSWCKHADPSAVSYPLYDVQGDSMQAVAQAFGRVGVRGAVVWLGYSWRDGPVEGWGALLGHIIRSFAKGRYSPPSDSSFMDRYPLRLDALVDSVASLADDTAEAIRRLLSAAAVGAFSGKSYPRSTHCLAYGGYGYGGYGYGGYGYDCSGPGYGGYGYGGYGGYGYGGYGYGGYGTPASSPPQGSSSPGSATPPGHYAPDDHSVAGSRVLSWLPLRLSSPKHHRRLGHRR